MKRRREHGFTLLELLVALAIFAVLSALAYSALNQVMKIRDHTTEQINHLTDLQKAVSILQRDIEQIVIREIRDEFGDTEPALMGGMAANDEFGDTGPALMGSMANDVLNLTRTGWNNPLGLPRSHLQRIAYGVDDGQLIRETWDVLDRAPGDNPPYREILLKGVHTMEVRFLDDNLQWQEYWPPKVVVGNNTTPLPRALEVTLDTVDFGRITRLFPLLG